MGAMQITGSNLKETAHFAAYVKPVKNPALSNFIVSFTGIKQADVNVHGVSFIDALEKLGHFIGDLPAYCWGRDIEVLKENCELNNIREPDFFWYMTNLKPILTPLFESLGVDTKQHTSGTLISAFTKTQEPRRAHDALNDMRNFRDAIRELRKRIA
jgi:inhibitor of KinA sporulation pathway (predicted exonuclease)